MYPIQFTKLTKSHLKLCLLVISTWPWNWIDILCCGAYEVCTSPWLTIISSWSRSVVYSSTFSLLKVYFFLACYMLHWWNELINPSIASQGLRPAQLQHIIGWKDFWMEHYCCLFSIIPLRSKISWRLLLAGLWKCQYCKLPASLLGPYEGEEWVGG